MSEGNGLKPGMAFYHCDTIDFKESYITVIVQSEDSEYIEQSPINPGVDFNFQLNDRVESASAEQGVIILSIERTPGHILH